VGDNPTLQHGSDDQQWVEYLQGLLQWQLSARGSSTTVPTTGTFDDATLAAVQEFQEVAGLMADGVVGDKTWEALLAEPPAAEAAEGSIVLDFADHDLTININEMEPNNLWMGGTNTGTAVMVAGSVVLTAELSGNTYELRTLNDSEPGGYFSFFSDANPEGWQQGDTYTVTAPAEVGGATKSGTLVTNDQSGY
jgi:hypothetical protein